MAKKELIRCPWPADDARMIEYHDTVWGTPEHDDRKLYAKLVLDAVAQRIRGIRVPSLI